MVSARPSANGANSPPIQRGSKTLTTALIIGFGELGRRIAALHLQRGDAVHVLGRSDATMAGVTKHRGDLDRPDALPPLPAAGSLLYYLAPPPPRGVEEPRLRALLERLGAVRPAHVVYISTSGIYGDHGGARVTEQTPPAPRTDRARRRLAAERALAQWCEASGVGATVLRVGGIYGPGRLPLARLERGEPVLARSLAPVSNRVHATDLAAIAVRAARRAAPGVTIYNACDDEPSTMSDYFFAVAEAAGLPPPPEIGLEEARRRLSPAMLSYLEESRRMDNTRLKRELYPRFIHPGLASGLTDCGLGDDHR